MLCLFGVARFTPGRNVFPWEDLLNLESVGGSSTIAHSLQFDNAAAKRLERNQSVKIRDAQASLGGTPTDQMPPL